MSDKEKIELFGHKEQRYSCCIQRIIRKPYIAMTFMSMMGVCTRLTLTVHFIISTNKQRSHFMKNCTVKNKMKKR